jgi:hypothetical protein
MISIGHCIHAQLCTSNPPKSLDFPPLDNRAYQVDHSCNTIAPIFVILTLWQAFVMAFVRIPLRIISLAAGDFAYGGYQLAKREWRAHWIESQVARGRSPTKLLFAALVVKESLKQLIKNIIKIALFPIAIIGLQLGAVCGLLVDPEWGRAIFGFTERVWARDFIPVMGLMNVTDFLAPCMQKKSVWRSYNFYEVGPYDRRDWRSVVRDIEHYGETERRLITCSVPGYVTDLAYKDIVYANQRIGHADPVIKAFIDLLTQPPGQDERVNAAIQLCNHVMGISNEVKDEGKARILINYLASSERWDARFQEALEAIYPRPAFDHTDPIYELVYAGRALSALRTRIETIRTQADTALRKA